VFGNLLRMRNWAVRKSQNCTGHGCYLYFNVLFVGVDESKSPPTEFLASKSFVCCEAKCSLRFRTLGGFPYPLHTPEFFNSRANPARCVIMLTSCLFCSGTSLTDVVRASSSVCKMPHLNGAACVVYGIPAFCHETTPAWRDNMPGEFRSAL